MDVSEAVNRGLSIIPVGANKRPLIPKWKPFQQRSATSSEVAEWQRTVKPAGWAMVTGQVSNTITLDFDGQQGCATLKKLGLNPHRRTPSGGFHVDFRWPGWRVATLNHKSKRELNEKWPGLDIRADGGYVIFAGRTTKGEYEWLRDFELYDPGLLPPDLRIFLGLEPPEDRKPMVQNNGNSITGSVQVDPEVLIRRAIENASSEGRNNAGFWLACQCRDNHYSEAEAEAIVSRYAARVPSTNTKGQRESYETGEAWASVRKAFERPPRDPWKRSSQRGTNATSSVAATVEASPDQPWTDPIPFQSVSPPAFPYDLFPGFLGDMAQACAKATETPIELAGMLGLAAVSACIAGRAIVLAEAGYHEPLNVFVAPSMESGNRKTSVLIEMTRPIREWEHEQAERIRPEQARVRSERKTLEARLENLRRQAAKSNAPTAAVRDIADLEKSMPEVPKIPKVWVQDITPEQLAVVMEENEERVAVLSDEGGIFDLLAGRYSSQKEAPNLDLFLQAHSGAPFRVDRRSQQPIYMKRPSLTVGISPQPDVLRSLADKPGFRGRGLLARFLYALPLSPLGYRTLEPNPIPSHIEANYRNGLHRLLNTKPQCEAHDGTPTIVLTLHADAYSAWKDFQRAIEQLMRDGEKLQQIRDWGSKLPGAALRIAGLFHAVQRPIENPAYREIDPETMECALNLATCLMHHAVAAFSLMARDERMQNADRLLKWIQKKGKPEFSVRDSFCVHQHIFHRKEALAPVLDLLEQHGHIRPAPETGGRSGRPSEMYQVNPITLSEGVSR